MDNKKLAITEGLLFINGDEGTTIEDIMVVLELENETEVEDIIKSLKEKYKNDLQSGLDIQKFAGNKYRLMTRKEDADYYVKLANVKTEAKLSSASIETLSIIAYKGPISKPEIEDIRGVNTDSIIYKLKLRNLITEAGKSDAIGKPMLYKVTDDFMKYFNINSLDELPKLKEDSDGEKDIFTRE